MALFGKSKEEVVRLRVEGMSCGHCVGRVTQALRGVRGVRAVTVSLERKEAVVTVDPGSVDRAELVRAVEAAGYRAE